MKNSLSPASLVARSTAIMAALTPHHISPHPTFALSETRG